MIKIVERNPRNLGYVLSDHYNENETTITEINIRNLVTDGNFITYHKLIVFGNTIYTSCLLKSSLLKS